MYCLLAVDIFFGCDCCLLGGELSLSVMSGADHIIAFLIFYSNHVRNSMEDGIQIEEFFKQLLRSGPRLFCNFIYMRY